MRCAVSLRMHTQAGLTALTPSEEWSGSLSRTSRGREILLEDPARLKPERDRIKNRSFIYSFVAEMHRLRIQKESCRVFFPYVNPAFSIVLLTPLRSTSNTRIYIKHEPHLSLFFFSIPASSQKRLKLLWIVTKKISQRSSILTHGREPGRNKNKCSICRS